MGLSNYVPNSRIAQPGVCTSTTRPATPYEGQVIFETDTNRVLVWDASAWVMIADTGQPPGMQLIKAQTIGTAVSSVAVESCFNADFNNYLVVVDSQSSANANLRMKLRNGSTDKSANYYTGAFYFDMVGGGAINGEGSGGALTTGFRIAAMNSASIFSTFINVGRPFTTTRTTVHVQPQASETYFRVMSGYHNENYSADGINIIPDSGTLTGGTVCVYGYRK